MVLGHILFRVREKNFVLLIFYLYENSTTLHTPLDFGCSILRKML